MALRKFGEKGPIIGVDAYIDADAVLIGDVRIGDRASVWPCAVLRADDDHVEIGRGSAVLDLAFCEAPSGRPVTVGANCIISHGARLHGCAIRDESVVGIGATVLDGATIGERSVLGAGCLIPPGSKIPPESFVVGLPGKVTRTTSSSDLKRLEEELRTLARKASLYRQGQHGST